MSMIRVSTELFPILDSTIEELRKKPLYEYTAAISQKLLDDYKTSSKVNYQIWLAFQRKHGISSLCNERILSARKIGNILLEVPSLAGSEPHQVSLALTKETNLDPLVQGNFPFVRLLNDSLEESLTKIGFCYNGYSFYSKEEDLSEKIRCKNKLLSRIRDFFHIYPGFNAKIRVVDEKALIQVQPHCVIDFEKDLYFLYKNNLLTRGEIVKLFPRVVPQINRLADLRSFWEKKTASDPIFDETFRGKSFMQFSHERYGVDLAFSDAKLIIVVPRGNRLSPWYFSSERTFPSISFEDMSSLDKDFFYDIQAEMKSFSAKRKDLLQRYFEQIRNALFFDNKRLHLGTMLSYEQTNIIIQPANFDEYKIRSFFTLPDPWVRFRDVNTMQPKDVSRLTGYLGAAGDLLRQPKSVSCFNVPPELRIKALYDSRLESSALELIYSLCEALDNGRSFSDMFDVPSVRLSYEPVEDFYDRSTYSDINPEKYDCVVVLGPRTIEGDPIKTRTIYTFSETEIMNRGVPVQFVSDDPAYNPKYDKSFKAKSLNPSALFGIGLNILGKVGASPLILSPLTTDTFLPNSIVLGYNVARIVEHPDKDISQEESPRKLVSGSIPLAAPIVIFSGSASELIQQYAYEVTDEASLFSGENGQQIFSDINKH